ncbi:MAG: hypothetical protein IMZ53_00480 [Thermoplasmata archaeon]|nr:hypothetical protein [Thermoplasmata archaeon]
MMDFLENHKKSNKWLIALNVIVQVSVLAAMLIAVGKMQAQSENIKGLDEFRIQTTATLAVACRNIEYLTKNVDYLIDQDRARKNGIVSNAQAPKYDDFKADHK